jgi:hypothetical protein
MARQQKEQPRIPQDWALFAWQGVKVMVPPDWSPSALTGNYEEGYVRLDGPDQPRLEVKWAQSGKFVNIEDVVQRYCKSLTKGREGKGVQTSESTKLSVKMPKDRSSVRFFSWRLDEEAYGAAWYCKTCGRVMLVQVLGQPGTGVDTLAEQVLSSFEDHPEGDYLAWALYGFSCLAPKEFRLTGQRLLTGLLELDFENGRDKLKIVRWGLANIALKDTDLEHWLRKESKKGWRNFHVILEPTDIHGHEGLAIAGPSAAPLVHLGAIALRMIGRKFPDVLRGAAWLCPQGNKIYHVEALIDPADEGKVAVLVQSMVCHKEGA